MKRSCSALFVLEVEHSFQNYLENVFIFRSTVQLSILSTYRKLSIEIMIDCDSDTG